MAGLNLHAIVIGIVVLTTALDVNGNVISVELSVSTAWDPVAEFFISSDKRTWRSSIEYCESTGRKLADLDKKDERTALEFALRHRNFPDGTKFWVFTCKIDPRHYCEGHCTEVTYTRKQLKIRLLQNTECSTPKYYICKEK